MKRKDYADFVRLMSMIKKYPEYYFELTQEQVTTKISYSIEDNIWVRQLIINGEVFAKSLFNPTDREIVEFCNQFNPDEFRSAVYNKIEEIENSDDFQG